MTAPSAEGISYLRARLKDGARLAALRSPFGDLRLIALLTIWYPTLAGRGGSVSRCDHNQAAGNRTQRSGGTTYAEVPKPNASRSSGEGVWGRGASLREAASPPESPPPPSLAERARGRGLFYRKGPSLAIIITHSLIQSFIIASQRAMDDEIPNLEVLRNPPS